MSGPTEPRPCRPKTFLFQGCHEPYFFLSKVYVCTLACFSMATICAPVCMHGSGWRIPFNLNNTIRIVGDFGKRFFGEMTLFSNPVPSKVEALMLGYFFVTCGMLLCMYFGWLLVHDGARYYSFVDVHHLRFNMDLFQTERSQVKLKPMDFPFVRFWPTLFFFVEERM